jgi:hypothetical protein
MFKKVKVMKVVADILLFSTLLSLATAASVDTAPQESLREDDRIVFFLTQCTIYKGIHLTIIKELRRPL